MFARASTFFKRGVDGLLHISEMSHRRGHKPAEFVKIGDVIDVKILRIDPDTGKLSLSLKQARGVDPWLDASTKYAIGTQVTGRVTKVESFGSEGQVASEFAEYQDIGLARTVQPDGKVIVVGSATLHQEDIFDTDFGIMRYR